VDSHIAETEVVDYGRRKQMRPRDAEKTRIHRQVVREVHVRGRNAALQSASERSLQTSGAERQERFFVREEETRRQPAFSGIEFLVPAGGELIVCVFAGLTDNELTGVDAGVAGRVIYRDTRIALSNDRRKQETIGIAAELITLKIQQRQGHVVDRYRNALAVRGCGRTEYRGQVAR